MKTITDCLKEYIRDNAAVFVFPTQIAADYWSEKALEVTGCGSVAAERFIAWDRFKESSVKSRVEGKKSVSSVLRSLFLYRLFAQNAAEPFFDALLPRPYAAQYAPFVGWFTRLLPSLALVKRTLLQNGGASDAEDRDLLTLEDAYARFLAENSLFEPAWEIPPFENDGKTYVIFFPDVIEDFDEYVLLLESSPHVRLVRQTDASAGEAGTAGEAAEKPDAAVFDNARQELRFIAAAILHDHFEAGIDFTDMALSVCDLETLEPYLKRELRLYSIPFQFQAGKSLQNGGGSFFALIQSCAQSGFALAAVKKLATQRVFPWKEPLLNEELVRFGEENRCDCAPDNKDPWLDAFRNQPRETRLAAYYVSLKASLAAMYEAKSFTALRSAYFAFRSRFFDVSLFKTRPEEFTAATDAVMARCLEELSSLIDIENEYPALTAVLAAEKGAASPLAFFLAILAQKQYLPKNQGRGVHVFAYKAASCAPFRRHYVINVSQGASSVVIRALDFLGREKRRRLGLKDKNASPAFFFLYQHVPEKTRFTCAEKTFSGYVSPHAFLADAAVKNPPPLFPACFAEEQHWWAFPQKAPFPFRLFAVQKRGYENWRQHAGAPETAPLQPLLGAATAAEQILAKKIAAQKNKHGCFRITASDMNSFFTCPLQWLYERVLAVNDPAEKRDLVEARDVGSFYHAVLRDVFDHIQREGSSRVRFADIAAYRELARRTAARLVADRLYFPALLPQLIGESALERFTAVLENFLTFFAASFDGAAVTAVESDFSMPAAEGAELTGKIDCVLYADDGFVILDFKKNTAPPAAAYKDLDEKPLGDFQIPLYKRLFEHASGKKDSVVRAAFLRIEKEDERVVPVFGAGFADVAAKPAYADAAAFEPVMDAFDQAAVRYRQAVEAGDFSPPAGSIPFKTCAACSFNTLCRTTFFISGDTYGL